MAIKVSFGFKFFTTTRISAGEIFYAGIDVIVSYKVTALTKFHSTLWIRASKRLLPRMRTNMYNETHTVDTFLSTLRISAS